MRARSCDLLVLVAGGVTPLAFAPFGYWPVCIVTLVVLFHLLPRGSRRRGVWRGWLFGVGFFGAGVSWVLESFQYSSVALPSALLLTAVMVMFLALFPALFAFLSRLCLPDSTAAASLAVLPGLWVLSEWARGTVLTGFGFLQMGYSQMDAPGVALAPLAGVYGTSFVVAFTAALIAWAVARTRERALRGGVVILVVWALLWSAQSMQWTEPTGDELEVAVVQGNVPQALKWKPQFRQRSVELYQGFTNKHPGADLVVWPETALPGLYESFTNELRDLEVQARATSTALLIGVPSVQKSAAGSDQYFNSVVAVGAKRDFYHKRHLVPFGEYVPLQGLFQPLIDLFNWPVSSFTHGDPQQTTLNVAGQTLGVSICFEIAFGRDIIAALPQAGLLVNVSNDAWFGESIGPHQHFQIARWRAKETGRFLVRATNTGVSAFVDDSGRVLASLPQFNESSLASRVAIFRGATPYVVTGDTPVLLFVLTLVVAIVIVTRRRNDAAES